MSEFLPLWDRLLSERRGGGEGAADVANGVEVK